MISNVKVYGLDDSVKASKYPMAVEIEKCTSEITPRTKSLAGCKKGTGHDQFLTGIIVQFDLKFTVKAWVEAERYHFFDFVSSQSTMHKIMEFDLDKSYIKWVDPRVIVIMKELVESYMADRTEDNRLAVLYTNPVGFQLTARMTTNYRQLKTMHDQREFHALPEWPTFCKWIESLPHFRELCLGDKE